MVDRKIIPERPIDRVVAGAGGGVDLIVGMNVDETRLFLVPGGAIDQVTAEA